ncbi:SDR family oxidoreductase [Nocardia sp. BSTN01]|uniref:SDR family NAD(P)-dependent oxidoreductase n=1 Tax=Nocardia sp. BSTN01 TaxID=2783665 RepID=UPI00188FB277|nr:SDR family oxidoreductase [Nocardia sp. BSTN01]MBF4997281.1 SDR family oxidoreductase [Nocardia sp. BSTN01]
MSIVNPASGDSVAWADLHTFQDRVAVVTGAGSGIGKAAAVRLSEAGAQVVLADLDVESAEVLAKSLPKGRAVAVRSDVATEEGADAYVDAALSTFGRIDHFYSNAGILGAAGPLLDASLDNWERTMGVNVLGTFHGLKKTAAQMLKQGDGGSIVVTASIAALRSGAGTAVYSASKAAAVNLVRTAAREWGPHGIRVNAVCPSPTYTNFAELPEEYVKVATARIPLGRLAQPDDIARAAVWLLSNGSGFVNGAVLPVDGGHEA